MVSLGERECSVQRRHQKVVEEAPSPIMTPDLRKRMGNAAVMLARAGGYTNAGTVEFLVDANLDFYFLEVNTRLQVEHPVTEQVTGLDLVKLQIAIAAGHRLPFAWETITPRGHAMEVRLYAEDPENNFFPSPGKILSRHAPSGPGIRLDEGVYEGWTVPNDYDPLLSKLIAWGNSREETIARFRRSLEEYTVTGIKTNAALFRRILAEPDFIRGEIHTTWLDELLQRPHANGAEQGSEDAAAIGAAVWHAMQTANANSAQGSAAGEQTPRDGNAMAATANWTARHEIRSQCDLSIRKQKAYRRTRTRGRPLASHSGRRAVQADVVEIAPNTISILLRGESHEIRVARQPTEN